VPILMYHRIDVLRPTLPAMTHRLTVDPQDFERQMVWLKRHPVPWLAYPYGAYDSHVADLARRAGYVLAVTTDHGPCQDPDRPLELRRLEVLDSTGVSGLAALLEARCQP
jgi:hypothetical protein